MQEIGIANFFLFLKRKSFSFPKNNIYLYLQQFSFSYWAKFSKQIFYPIASHEQIHENSGVSEFFQQFHSSPNLTRTKTWTIQIPLLHSMKFWKHCMMARVKSKCINRLPVLKKHSVAILKKVYFVRLIHALTFSRISKSFKRKPKV